MSDVWKDFKVRSKFNKFEHARTGWCTEEDSETGALQMGTPALSRQKDTTENITFPQLHWLVVNRWYFSLYELFNYTQASLFSFQHCEFLNPFNMIHTLHSLSTFNILLLLYALNKNATEVK